MTGTNHCFAVNDEKKYAQFFDIDGRKIEPKEVIRLLPDTVDGVDMKEIDAEGVAYAPAAEANGISYFYITGSHGRSRNGSLRPSVFFLFRVPVSTVTGRPEFAFSEGEPSPNVERTALLRETIKSRPELADRAEQPLDQNGVTIEGLAMEGDSLLFGFRSPCHTANAYIMRVPVHELFKDAVPSGTVEKLALGADVGVRDLAAVKGGVMILAGRSQDDVAVSHANCGQPIETEEGPPAPSVWFWDGKNEPHPLGMLPGVGPGDKAETLMLLDESESEYRALIMFDGAENGEPIEFLIKK
ncbi:DUF3616 domain-containing protein [Rhizobium gallicum]|uniref:DUF3616 domain-containing protein n=1 Tax=Rhizobium gallicum TaxID=56730 RepID=UPI000A4B4833|nr:DUF3616 domain-containing protein [Rhizobium gallicum]